MQTDDPHADSAPSTPAVEYYRPPRLGIIHLLAWTATTAIALKINLAEVALSKAMFAQLGIDRPEVSQLNLVRDYTCATIHCMILGAGLVGAAVLVRAWYRGIAGKLQPGHWIVLIGVFGTVCSKSLRLLGNLLRLRIWGVEPMEASLGMQTVMHLVTLIGLCLILFWAALYLYVAWKKLDDARWKTFFVLAGVWPLIQMAILIIPLSLLGRHWFPYILPRVVVLGIPLAVASTLDLRAGCRRDWLHWLGVAMIAAGILVSLGLYVVTVR